MGGFMAFSEMVKRIEEAFPEFDVAMVSRRVFSDARNRVPMRLGWEIAIAEKIEKPVGQEDSP